MDQTVGKCQVVEKDHTIGKGQVAEKDQTVGKCQEIEKDHAVGRARMLERTWQLLGSTLLLLLLLLEQLTRPIMGKLGVSRKNCFFSNFGLLSM